MGNDVACHAPELPRLRQHSGVPCFRGLVGQHGRGALRRRWHWKGRAPLLRQHSDVSAAPLSPLPAAICPAHYKISTQCPPLTNPFPNIFPSPSSLQHEQMYSNITGKGYLYPALSLGQHALLNCLFMATAKFFDLKPRPGSIYTAVRCLIPREPQCDKLNAAR